jgi:hypothetical protein
MLRRLGCCLWQQSFYPKGFVPTKSFGHRWIHAIPLQVYGVPHPTIPGRVTNLAPYCEQYFNERNFPWGFHSHRIAGHPTGYPIWLDINLSHAEMLRWIQYLEDGLHFDTATERVTFELVTYNADLQLFSKSTLLLVSENGGAYRVQNLVETLKVCSL